MARRASWIRAYAVLRAPEALDAAADLNLQIKVVSVWPDSDSAASEVARLNSLPSADGQHYWWQSTHLHPESS